MTGPSRYAHGHFAKHLAVGIKDSRKSRSLIAREMGYASSASVTALMQGKARLPLAKLVPLADAIGMKRDLLLWRWLETYESELARVLQQCELAAVSYSELWWLINIRMRLAPFEAPKWDKEVETLMRPVLKAIKLRLNRAADPPDGG